MLPNPLRRQREEYAPPRTVLSFYAWVLGLLEAGVVALAAVLATDSDLHYLVPFVLAFGAVILLTLIIVVVLMNLRAPEKLQLEQVSAREYIEYQQVLRGDSIAGDYLEAAPPRAPGLIPASAGSDSADDAEEGASALDAEIPAEEEASDG